MGPLTNAFSVDVEDYFHPSELDNALRRESWSALSPRVDIGVKALLELLAQSGTKATFFVLGWVAERHPAMIREIAEAGHEIGCHSHMHRLVYTLTPSEFVDDTLRACSAIRHACGITPRLYRAPSYSIVESSLWALDLLVQMGFTHDSSVFPIAHDRYGIPGFPRHPHVLRLRSGDIVEVPIATVQLNAARTAPVGGGAYLRLFPYRYSAAGIRRINAVEKKPACIYTHPWELDPEQPRLARGFISRARTYTGLRTVRGKIERLLSEFRFSSIGAVNDPLAAELPVVSG